MTEDERKRLRELAEAATPGPWREYPRCDSAGQHDACGVESEIKDESYHSGYVSVFHSDAYDECTHPISAANAAFIAAANPTAVVALLDENERLRASHALRDEGYASADYQAVAENIAHDPRWAVRADSQRVARWALSLQQQLAAMTKARDEACELVDEIMDPDWNEGQRRLDAIRKVGQP